MTSNTLPVITVGTNQADMGVIVPKNRRNPSEMPYSKTFFYRMSSVIVRIVVCAQKFYNIRSEDDLVKALALLRAQDETLHYSFAEHLRVSARHLSNEDTEFREREIQLRSLTVRLDQMVTSRELLQEQLESTHEELQQSRIQHRELLRLKLAREADLMEQLRSAQETTLSLRRELDAMEQINATNQKERDSLKEKMEVLSKAYLASSKRVEELASLLATYIKPL